MTSLSEQTINLFCIAIVTIAAVIGPRALFYDGNHDTFINIAGGVVCVIGVISATVPVWGLGKDKTGEHE